MQGPIEKIDGYNYYEVVSWVLFTYNKWIERDNNYAYFLIGNREMAHSEREGAINSLTNLKRTLEGIAILKMGGTDWLLTSE